MRQTCNNFAYIDAANLHNGILGFGWKLDYARFRVWLTEKYGVKTAYIFIGLLQATRDVYEGKCNQAIVVTSDGDYASLILHRSTYSEACLGNK